ncbi:10951_t:CDS:1, partial [Cetraspora pellucida]
EYDDNVESSSKIIEEDKGCCSGHISRFAKLDLKNISQINLYYYYLI